MIRVVFDYMNIDMKVELCSNEIFYVIRVYFSWTKSSATKSIISKDSMGCELCNIGLAVFQWKFNWLWKNLIPQDMRCSNER
jgi:hypothetical protein